MNTKIRRVITGLLVFVLLYSLAPQPARIAGQSAYTAVSLAPVWTTGSLSDGVGPARIVVADLNHDDLMDIATCSNGYVYILNSTADGEYGTLWFGEYIGCSKLASADRDADGVSELYAATTSGKVVVIDGATQQTLGTFTPVSGLVASDIAVADVDGDGAQEIVLACSSATLVYDASNYILEWQATGLGGFEVAVGNIDTDLLPEVVVNADTAHILNASLQTQEWAFSGGFGIHMGVGDVDGDAMSEIAYIKDYYQAYVIEGDTQTIKWAQTDLSDLESVSVADVDDDGESEVLIGNGQWGSVTGYRGNDGLELWSIPNPEHGVFGISAGDVDDDGDTEILWGAGLTSSGKDTLCIGDWQREVLEWSSTDLDGPLFVAAGDVDNDHQGEIVMASHSTTSGYVGGTITVYDGTTHQVEWSAVVGTSYFDVYQLAVGQLDSDPPLEILVGGDNWYNTRLQSYDGDSGLVEWQSADLGGGAPKGLLLRNIDDDSVDEVFVALVDTKNVQVFQGASNFLLWDSGALDGYIQDMAIGDLDGDAVMDLAVLTGQSVYVFEVGTWTVKLHQPFTSGVQVAIAPADTNGGGELLLVTASDASAEQLQAWDGSTFAVNWQFTLGEAVLKELATADLDADGIQEFILMGNEGFYENPNSLLWIGARGNPRLWEYQYPGYWGTINSMAVSDVDNDGQAEFLFGSSNLIQVDRLASIDILQAYLPLVVRNYLPPTCLPLYVDDFSNPASGWPVSDTGDVLFEYNGGEYRMLVRTSQWGAGARPGFSASDYLVSVDLRNPTSVNGSYGLAFGMASDWSSLYTLEIYPDGRYGIYRFDPTQVLALATGVSDSILRGSATNQISVERNGASIKAYANGQLLASVTDGTYLGTRYLGLIVFSYDQPNVDIRFDNFVVKPISCDGAMTSASDGQPLQPGSQIFDFSWIESRDLSR